MIQTHPTEKVGVGLCLPEEGLVLCHGVLVQHLLSVCFVHKLKLEDIERRESPSLLTRAQFAAFSFQGLTSL